MAKPLKATKAATTETDEAEARRQRVTETAYFLAEKRGFGHGHALDDWCQAEEMFAVDAPAVPKNKLGLEFL